MSVRPVWNMRFKLIQVFRAVAALLVVSHHLIANTNTYFKRPAFGNFFNFGFIGVDFFFVLSGFIITYIHFSDIVSQGNWLTFFKKRFIRIYPIYWVIATVTLIVYTAITPAMLKDVGLTMDFKLPVIRNFVLQSYLLIPQEVLRLVGVSWTLSYEILFYLVFGICIAGGYRLMKFILPIWVGAIILNALYFQSTNYYVDFALNILILEFVLGCFVAYAIIHRIEIPFKFLRPALVIIFFILLNTMHIYGLVFKRDLMYVLLSGVFFSIITYSAVNLDLNKPNINYSSMLILLGNASYSIYLFHNFLISGFCRIYIKLNPGFADSVNLDLVALIIFVITVITGVLIHLVIEKRLISFFSAKLLREHR